MGTHYYKITPNLWFDNQAVEAVQFYTGLFKNSEIGKILKYGKEGQEIHGQPEDAVMNVEFKLAGQPFLGLNGGPIFQFNSSISLFVICETKEEIDTLWRELSDGGNEMMPLDKYEWSERYGWLNDRFGLSWQLMQGDIKNVGQKITPLLFFTGEKRGKAEEAVKFYNSVFKNSRIDGILKYGEENAFANGTVMHSQFRLNGQTFMAMDSGVENDFPFNEAISFIIDCKDQDEIDYFWDKLSEGGDPAAQQCGWLKDKFGVSWQVVPISILTGMLTDPDREKRGRVTNAFMQMKKFEIEKLQKAYEGQPS